MKVLYLAGWYPNKDNPVSGVFIKRYAIAASKKCDVAVLYVHLGSADNGIDISRQNGLLEVIVYRRDGRSRGLFGGLRRSPLVTTLILLIASIQGLRVALKEFGKPDLIHLNVTLYIHLGLLALGMKVLMGVPYIATEHHIGYSGSNGKLDNESPLVRSLIRLICKRASAITTVSASLRDDMIRCGIKNSFIIIPNVIVSDFEAVSGSAASKQKKALHVSILNDAQKNISGIIEATAIVSKSRDDIELHIVGDGVDRHKFEALACGYNLLNKVVFFHGRVDQQSLIEAFKGCDFFVLFSNVETFSVVAAEAISWGKPAIVTRCGGPEEFIDEKCGVVLNPGDIEKLVEAINFMLDNSSMYDAGEICKYAKAKFSSEVVGEQLYDIYKKAAI